MLSEVLADEVGILSEFCEKSEGPAELMFRVGPDGQYLVVYANGQAQNQFAVSRCNLGSEPVYWENLPKSLMSYLTQVFEVLSRDQNGVLPVFETDIPQKRSFAVKVQVHKAQYGDGWYCWFFFSFNDVTPWLGLQEEVMNARKLESVGALASGVAHDFNNLLMVIQGHAEYLLMTRRNDLELREAMERVVKVCASGASLTKSLLGYARKQSLEMDTIDVVQLVKEVVNLARRSYGTRYQIELMGPFDQEVGGTLREIVISGCYSALSNCLLNVLNNSRDAMPKGGKISIYGHIEDGCLAVSVVDAGTGIEEQNLKAVFEPFFTTKKVGTGTGLGLPMVQGIMRQHGGNVEIKSKKNVGTEFIFYWPLHQQQEKIPSKGTNRETTFRLPLPVLEHTPRLLYLIEDDEHVKASIKLLTQINGYETKTFGGSRDVLTLLREGQTPEIIMVDYEMPEMDGLMFIREACAIMRNRAKMPFTKLVLMSGYPVSYFHEFLQEFDGVPISLLHKPFSRDALMKVIQVPSQRPLRKITSRISAMLFNGSK